MSNLTDTAEYALEVMTNRGFDDSQVAVSTAIEDEVYIGHNEANMLRSTEEQKLALTGIVAGRKAATELTAFDRDSIGGAVDALYANALLAPVDEANAVSSGQEIAYANGPLESDLDKLTDKVAELLEFRQLETPLITMDEGGASHRLSSNHIVTSKGSVLSSQVGSYSLLAFGTATEGDKSSSLAYAGGSCLDLDQHATAYFGIEDMLRTTERQIHTRSLDGNFSGEVVLTPPAVSDLLSWLLAQLSDMQLLSNSSVFQARVGEQIASPLLSVFSRFDGPGIAPITADGFVTEPVQLLEEGCLKTLLPSLYGSRKTGIAHCPTTSGWCMAPGETPTQDLGINLQRGAWVGRLSMGRPAANGDFSGVIKGSFEIVDGEIGDALSEVMITGNMADMLLNVVAASSETIDTGSECLPWLRISGLHFS